LNRYEFFPAAAGLQAGDGRMALRKAGLRFSQPRRLCYLGRNREARDLRKHPRPYPEEERWSLLTPLVVVRGQPSAILMADAQTFLGAVRGATIVLRALRGHEACAEERREFGF